EILQDRSWRQSCSSHIPTTQQLGGRTCKYLLHPFSNLSDSNRLPNKMVLPLTTHLKPITSRHFLDHLHKRTLAHQTYLLLATLLSILLRISLSIRISTRLIINILLNTMHLCLCIRIQTLIVLILSHRLLSHCVL